MAHAGVARSFIHSFFGTHLHGNGLGFYNTLFFML
ncbi:hypothetical protein APA386B_313 [Acetobacter pasteurianus 386B]|nr:hypothetical protein APA386B_313 [Acetobacter pasteurianus 386B]